MADTKISILNLIPKYQDETQKEAFERALGLARFAEENDFSRYWVAEHHNTRAVLGSATDVVLGYLLANTDRLRVGAGGVMLPNHTPFQVAERYGTLEALYPGRVDLGVGRAPGTDRATARLIYRDHYDQESFAAALSQLQDYMSDDADQLPVAPTPGIGAKVPIYVLGSSDASAYVAAELGLPYSFAGHFSPNSIGHALDIYRKRFRPSEVLQEPYVILGLTTNIAETEEAAEELAFHASQVFLHLIHRQSKDEFLKMDPDQAPELTSIEKFYLRAHRGLSISGSIDEARDQYKAVMRQYAPDEIIGATYISDPTALKDNFRLLADIVRND
ncbi:MsnO8 family LLM class oxidoreductase [Peptococcus simiae]|uniref:MsnO8 family LLM class oxidoreductase n=1 Tax=Peptococcus simiae TaxID=1643805 RepID=UPI00397FBDAB